MIRLLRFWLRGKSRENENVGPAYVGGWYRGTVVGPVEVYPEQFWEVFDPSDARVLAHFFDENYAGLFQEFVNDLRARGGMGWNRRRADDE